MNSCICSLYNVVCNMHCRRKPHITDWGSNFYHHERTFYPINKNDSIEILVPQNSVYEAVIDAHHIDMFMDFYVLNDKNGVNMQDYSTVSIIARYRIMNETVPDEYKATLHDPVQVGNAYFGRLIREELFDIYDSLYTAILRNVNMANKNFNISKLETYTLMKSNIPYPIMVDCLYSTIYAPASAVDHDVINEICKCLLNNILDHTVNDIINEYIVRNRQEFLLSHAQTNRRYRMHS